MMDTDEEREKSRLIKECLTTLKENLEFFDENDVNELMLIRRKLLTLTYLFLVQSYLATPYDREIDILIFFGYLLNLILACLL